MGYLRPLRDERQTLVGGCGQYNRLPHNLAQIIEAKEKHPYTMGLINCIPDLSKDEERLKPIPGRMVDPRIIPTGCCFADRCPHCMEICKKQPPEIHDLDGHLIMCQLFDAENGGKA